ncbi:MAG: nitrate reductase cytochrome c-type subunit [Campylobacterota bacterium]|nr:nitrate reductase cytochrome c-type subunit [Campylobacterota bacterium]
MKFEKQLSIALMTAILMLTGCNEASSAAPAAQKSVSGDFVTEESLGLRKTDLYSEKADTVGDKTALNTATAGTSKMMKRAFQDAPPMISHSVEGMLPITISNNACTGCHLPDVASSMGATSIPSSHFMNFRPTSMAVSGKNTSSADMADVSIKKEQKLVGARFNCSQCHAPQSTGDLVVENTFEAQYTDKDGATKSSWSGTSLTDGLDTLKD